MSGLWAVARKELLEALGDRHSLHGLFAQGGLLFLTTGVVVPWLAAGSALWLDTGALTALYALFPAAFASFLAADAVAGELERGTFETLCATPVTDLALVLGKTAAAVLLGVALSYLSQAAGLLIVVARGGADALFTGPVLATRLLAPVVAVLLSSALGVVVSSRVPVARSAQQVCLVVNLVAFFAGQELLRHVPRPAGSAGVLAVEAIVLLAAGGLLALAAAVFRRERFFER